jgi:NAD-dependent deacetylase
LPEDIWEEAERAVRNCECLLVIGTSAVVYPAAGLIDLARAAGASIIEINPQPSAVRVAVVLCGPSGQILPELVRRL